MPAPIVVLTGPPGTGKTTVASLVASLVADSFPQSAVVEKMHDEFSRAPIESRHLLDGNQEPAAVARALVERIDQGTAVITS